MANIEGLQRVMEYIKDNPEEWDQRHWNTCFAGTTLRVLKGAVLEESDCCRGCGDLVLDGKVLSEYDIPDMAREALGLDATEAFRLFRAGNALEHVERLVAEFSAEAAVSA
jgi:hypothetical protein